MIDWRPLPHPDLLKRFGWMENSLARGCQPDGDGFRWLKDHGFELIVNFRKRDDSGTIERAAPGLVPVRIPVRDDHAPSVEQCVQWLELCAVNLGRRPIYFHCKQGNGRTSTFAVVFRIAQGRELGDALEEERAFGFERPPKHAKQYEFLEQFYARVRSGEITLPRLPAAR